jgi:hypothetical protein
MSIYAGSSKITSVASGGVVKNTINIYKCVAYYDVMDTSCWVDGSSTLYDLASSSNLTAYGSITKATFGSAVGWNFNAVGKRFNGSIATQADKNLTIEVWLYPAASEVISGDRGTVVQIHGNNGAYMSWNKDNRYLSNYWYGHQPEGYHETNGPSARGAWHHWCSVWDFGQGMLYQYVDSVVTRVVTSGNAATGSTLDIGQETGQTSRQYSGGIAVVRIYNRALHPNEVYEHWHAEKGRFGV